MFSLVYSVSLSGMEGRIISVEANVTTGLPQVNMVGLLSSEVREARERMRTAIQNTGLTLPPRRYTISLSPADIPKWGNHFDLPISLAVLCGIEVVPPDSLKETMALGELGLTGNLKPVNGMLAMVCCARKEGFRRMIIPLENAREAAEIPGIEIYAFRTLKEAIRFLKGEERPVRVVLSGERGYFTFAPEQEEEKASGEEEKQEDFAEVNGQLGMKRAAIVAAAGFHNLMFVGPPGAGKSMIAKRLPGILPPLTREEAIEVTQIYSICGMLDRKHPLIVKRPFRSPHHTCSAIALVGGGTKPKPGEISLAHKGVLFLDEMPEFSRTALEVLRQPMEDRNLHITRLKGSVTFPADFILAAAANPCPCGYYPDRSRCHCTERDILRYKGRISRPVLDRMDICVEAPVVKATDLKATGNNMSSDSMRDTVMKAVKKQQERYQTQGICFNAQLSPGQIERYCPMTPEAEHSLMAAFERLSLSARAYHRILRVARTIADLEEEDTISEAHIYEAICYRFS